CAEVAVALAPPSRIDRDNILQASLWALARAVCALPNVPRLVFVDGPFRPPLDQAFEVEPIIGGDGLVSSIAAASIVAKVTRDRLMTRLGAAFPAYGFERHKGYGTLLHAEALEKHGATPHHRASFAPVIAVRALVTVED
ncbi:MAG: ribonuclease HII, partial [Xanthobacteraceae bacterium]|nr:ribonuclease HII [Xanthobacteraceae bacterium]